MGPAQTYDVERPWTRQPFETERDYARFQTYLHTAPPRSLTPLAKTLGMGWAALDELARDHGWLLRARTYDAHLDRLRLETVDRVTEETAASRARRHMRPLTMALEAAERELAKLAKLSKQAEGPGVLSPRDILRFLEIGIKYQRLIAGDLDPVQRHSVDLSNLSLDELRALRDLQQKVGG